MLFVLVFAFVGFLARGLPGLLLGALIGYLLSSLVRSRLRAALQRQQARFVQATFSVMGAVCKADGVVTRDEIQVAEALFDRLHLSPAQRETAKAAFNRGKAADFDLDAELDGLAGTLRANSILFQLFMQAQLLAVAADGQVHPAEHAMLVRVARRLGLSERDVAQLEALLRSAQHGPTTNGKPTRARVDDAYAVLGVESTASDDEIKRAYRKLMTENHPDRLASRGLPENMRQLAEERARDINAAYDVIRKAREAS